jgi:hypothetical protein
LAEAFGDQLVLGGEMTIKRHLIGTGRLRDGLDADASNPIPVEQLGRDSEESV